MNSIFTVRINSKSFPWPVRSVQKYKAYFRQRPMYDIVRRYATWLTDMEEKQT